MSQRARAYQKFITGTDMVYELNGVIFDGFKDGVLLEAKGYYKQFVNPKTGEFKKWWVGRLARAGQTSQEPVTGCRERSYRVAL